MHSFDLDCVLMTCSHCASVFSDEKKKVCSLNLWISEGGTGILKYSVLF
jgi:hypothetical protein